MHRVRYFAHEVTKGMERDAGVNPKVIRNIGSGNRTIGKSPTSPSSRVIAEIGLPGDSVSPEAIPRAEDDFEDGKARSKPDDGDDAR